MNTLLLLVIAALTGIMRVGLQDGVGLLPLPLVFWLNAGTIACLCLAGAQITIRAINAVLLPRWLRRPPDDILKAFVVAVAYGLALATLLRLGFDQDLRTILTASALLTAILGFALQATLGNVFSGTALQIEQPYRAGDVLRFGAVMGRVEKATWRATHLRSLDGFLTIVPNSTINAAAVDVMRAGRPVRFSLRLPMPILVSPDQACDIIGETFATLEARLHARDPAIFIDAMGANEGVIWYRLAYFLDDPFAVETVESEMRARLWYALDRLGLALPISSVYRGFPVLPDAARAIEDRLPAIERFVGAGAQAVDALKAGTQRRIFAAGEHFHTRPATAYMLHRGILAVPVATPWPASPRDGGWLPLWQAAALRDLSTSLAHYIGPAAHLLVPQVAATSRDPWHVTHSLADTIPDPEDRRRFLDANPSTPLHLLEAGALFTAAELAADAVGPLIVLTEAELLEFPEANAAQEPPEANAAQESGLSVRSQAF